MLAQIFAIVIFLIMLVMIVLDKYERHLITLGGALIMVILVFGMIMQNGHVIIETLNIQSVFKMNFWYGEATESAMGINWATIIFIAGMMVMVEGMARAGFFRWLCLRLAKMVKYRTMPVFITFMIMSGVLAMFIDSITVILFLAAATIELSRMLKFNPVPLIVAEIFCANLGGSATMCGDPPNIIIGTALHYSFFDFLVNTGVIAAVSFVFVLIYFYYFFRKETKKSDDSKDPKTVYPNPSTAIKNKKAFLSSTIIFLIVVILLVTHSITTISVASIGVLAAVLTVLIGIAVFNKEDLIHIFKNVDYKTLLFFIGLFVAVGGLEHTHVLELIADFLGRVSRGNLTLMVIIILWVSAIASAFVDNIPFAATMVPVIRTMAASQGVSLDILAWTLAVGTDIGGSATPIGASANIVGTSVAAKEGHLIRWGTYCKYATVITVIVLIISMIMILLRYVF